MGGHRSGTAMHPRQGRGQLDQPEGRRSRVPRAGPHHSSVRCRGRGHGLRRARPSRQLPAPHRHLRPRLPPAGRRGRIRSARHHFRPQHLPGRHGHGGAPPQCAGLLPRHGVDPNQPAGRARQRRCLQRQLQLPGQSGGARSDAQRLSLPRHPGRHGPRHRQPDHADRVRRHPRRPARTRGRRTARSPGRRYGAPH